jgi:hypothetical protein
MGVKVGPSRPPRAGAGQVPSTHGAATWAGSHGGKPMLPWASETEWESWRRPGRREVPLVLLWYELTVFCRLQKSTVPQHCSATKVVGAVVAWRVLIEPTRRFHPSEGTTRYCKYYGKHPSNTNRSIARQV